MASAIAKMPDPSRNGPGADQDNGAYFAALAGQAIL
jgi:hypothetical protein